MTESKLKIEKCLDGYMHAFLLAIPLGSNYYLDGAAVTLVL